MSIPVPGAVSPGRAGWLLVQRDLRLGLRRPGEWLQPLIFFFVVTTLFPLATDPELSRLRDMAPGALWVAALLSSLLALELLFREDGQDGTLEQLAVSGLPLPWLLLAKTCVHWLLTGLPLVLAFGTNEGFEDDLLEGFFKCQGMPGAHRQAAYSLLQIGAK